MDIVEKGVKKKSFTSRRVVEEAIDVSKSSKQRSWYELLSATNDSRASYPTECQEAPEDPREDSE